MAKNTWEQATVWHELMSEQPERAKKFYHDVVGLTVEPLEGSPFPYMVWMHDDVPIGGLVPPQNGQQGWPSGKTPHWVSSFVVEDVDQAVKTAQELGGEVLVPPTDIPKFGRAAVLKDPEGAVFGIFQGPA
ncbi:MAG: VOC family protein [Planctomycetaceae bacterium]|nr:MAG: VOC family protein [Planctomycetaceae bacterium]